MMRFAKRTGVLLLVLTLLIGALPVAAAASARGDINADGAINAADALMALQHSVRLITLDGEQTDRADVSGDGAVNAADALLILQYSVKLITEFPADAATIPWSPSTPTCVQTTAPAPTSTVRTTFQQAGGYGGEIDVQSDAVMAYILGFHTVDSTFDSWAKNNATGRRIDVMIAGGRDDGEYFRLYPEREKKDAHMGPNGNYLYHGGGTTVHYMMPTTYYMEYKWTLVDAICQKGPGVVVIEEPELFVSYCYNDGFYEEWQNYYGTPFVDPRTSAEARYMACKLMWHMWVRFYDTIGRRMAEKYPDVQLGVAAHSTPSYNGNILSAQNGYTALPTLKFYIGQTWSDTVRGGRYYRGETVTRAFEAGYFEYGSYVDSIGEGQTLYTLTDAKADNDSLTWDEYEYLWQETVAAELMRPEINHFQECVWPSRGFTPAPERYRTVQLSVYNTLHEVGDYGTTLYAGTPGIYMGLSDTVTFQILHMMRSTNDPGLDGLSLPLIERGIPLNTLALDRITSAEDLKDVKLLILSWDMQKPVNEQINVAIADWVKAGGVLLYIGGHSEYDAVSTEWWTKQGQTPLENLYGHLGLSGIQAEAMEPFLSVYDWVGPSGWGQSFGGDGYLAAEANFALSFTGTGFTKLVENADAAFIVESAAGKGHVVTVGLPTAYFGMNARGPEQMRELVAYACRYLNGVNYKETDLMVIRRGPFVAAHALKDGGKDQVLTGDFIDLFDENLTVLTQKTVPADRSALLYDLTEDRKAATPVLVHTGGNLRGEVTQTAERTAFVMSGPTSSTSATRFLGNGKTPAAVNLTLDGEIYKDFIALWDNASDSLLLTVKHDAAQELAVEILWGADPVPDTVPYTWQQTRVAINSGNLDADYIHADTSRPMRTQKLVTYDSELIYKFDLAGLRDPYFMLDVMYNYLIQVSTDGVNWTTVYDRSTVDDEYVTTASSRCTLGVHPERYCAAGLFYIRLGNDDVTREYGTGISGLTLYAKTDVA